MHLPRKWHERTGSGLNQNKCYTVTGIFQRVSRRLEVQAVGRRWNCCILNWASEVKLKVLVGKDLTVFHLDLLLTWRPKIRGWFVGHTKIHWTYYVYIPAHKWSMRYKLDNVMVEYTRFCAYKYTSKVYHIGIGIEQQADMYHATVCSIC